MQITFYVLTCVERTTNSETRKLTGSLIVMIGRSRRPRIQQICCHISHVVSVLCRIMAYRINLFVNDAVTVLLSLKRLLVPVEVCLLPLTQFLQSYINSLQEWLYRSCYRRVMEFLWIFIVRHVMKFMTEQKRTIRVLLLLPEAVSADQSLSSG
ncbi:uncharacterized protein [Mytilus edulis]|uniref:uncharacterized protein isoform X7 n=1 Tax=Mytilus edulis TaxID=6550 RepID=UPI0039EF9632